MTDSLSRTGRLADWAALRRSSQEKGRHHAASNFCPSGFSSNVHGIRGYLDLSFQVPDTVGHKGLRH
jgi:hypothetical protein